MSAQEKGLSSEALVQQPQSAQRKAGMLSSIRSLSPAVLGTYAWYRHLVTAWEERGVQMAQPYKGKDLLLPGRSWAHLGVSVA